jgi:hypothetical protein
MAEQLGAPSPPPMSEGRACAACSTMNPASATFCWKCFATLPTARAFPAPAAARSPSVPGGPMPAPPQPQGSFPPPGTPAPGPWTGQTPPPAPKKSRRPLAILIGVVAAILGYVAVGALFKTDLTMPESIAGISRDHSAAAQRIEAEAKQGFGQNGIRTEGAAYGVGGPEYFVIAAADASSDPDETFQGYANGFATGSHGQATVDVDARATTQRDGATYICADVTGGVSGQLCLWQTDHVTGFVTALAKERPEALAFTREAASVIGA